MDKRPQPFQQGRQRVVEGGNWPTPRNLRFRRTTDCLLSRAFFGVKKSSRLSSRSLPGHSSTRSLPSRSTSGNRLEQSSSPSFLGTETGSVRSHRYKRKNKTKSNGAGYVDRSTLWAVTSRQPKSDPPAPGFLRGRKQWVWLRKGKESRGTPKRP